MYKLILGNVRITVSDDSISQAQAASAARKAMNEALQQGKLLSHVEIRNSETGIEVLPTERDGCRASRKTLKQSMLDVLLAAAREKLYPANTYTSKDSWFDTDTGQEWHGQECNVIRDELMEKLETWTKQQ